MRRKLIGALVLGIAGCAVLLALGVWQVERLNWKRGILSEIASRIDAPVADLPAALDPQADRYRPVAVSGRFTGQEVRVLTSLPGIGAGYRIIGAFVTEDGRRIMVDRGGVPQVEGDVPRPAREAQVTGNLHWPREADGFTPDPELERNIWFARDVPRMAEVLDTEPVLIVARSETGQGVVPLPVSVEGIPNNHLQYAVTWFTLAAIWAGMTVLLVWRITRQTKERV